MEYVVALGIVHQRRFMPTGIGYMFQPNRGFAVSTCLIAKYVITWYIIYLYMKSILNKNIVIVMRNLDNCFKIDNCLVTFSAFWIWISGISLVSSEITILIGYKITWYGLCIRPFLSSLLFTKFQNQLLCILYTNMQKLDQVIYMNFATFFTYHIHQIH